MPPPAIQPVTYDLLLSIKETQLQHGLRAENHARYHQYLTHRLATLRRQLGLGNDRKKFLHKEVTAANATDPRHFELLALYAERCWAEAEAQISKRNTAKVADNQRPVGGVPPASQSGKRLNKAVVWSAQLLAIGEAVADPRLKVECVAYHAETRGRCHALHRRFDDARRAFIEARNAYFSLHGTSSEQQWPIVLAKVVELDDRIYYAMQCLGEDPTTYKPQLGSAATTQFATTVEWNGRRLLVSSVKVKDSLREAIRSDPIPMRNKALEGGSIVNVGMQNRVLDAFDRTIGLYNDALAHCRQDLREASEGRKTELQLLVHYLSYHVSLFTYERTMFMVDVFERRFFATKEVITTGKLSKDCPVAQYASPLEVIRLYDAALEAVGDMNLLPGVMGSDAVVRMEAECRGGRFVMLGESWRIAADSALASACFTAAAKALKEVSPPSTRSGALMVSLQRSVVALTAESVLQSSPSTGAQATLSSSTTVYLTDALDECKSSNKLVKFPPDYQAVPCKPVFVDIASTFVEYPPPPSSESSAPAKQTSAPQVAEATTVQSRDQPQQEEAQQVQQQPLAQAPDGGSKAAGWGGWFGWGKK